MSPATVHHLRPVPDQDEQPVSLVKDPPRYRRWRRLAGRRPGGRVLRAVGGAVVRHLGYSAVGSGRWAAGGWRWLVAGELAGKLESSTPMVLAERARRRKAAAWTAAGGVVVLVWAGGRWWPLALPVLAAVVFVAAGFAERARRQDAATQDGRPAAGKRPGSKVVRAAFAAAKVGKFEDVRVIGPIVRDADVAWTGLVELPSGVTAQQAIKKLPNVAAALGVDQAQLALDPVRGHAGRVLVWCADSDPLAGDVIASPVAQLDRFDIWRDKIPLLFDVRRRPVWVSLVERSILVGGEPGGGKSVACNNLLCCMALDPSIRLWLADGKGVDLLDYEPLAERFLAKPDPAALVTILEEAIEELERRYAAMARARVKKITADVADDLGIYPLLLHIDELAFFTRSKFGDEITELLRDFVSRGRAALMMLSAATQRPSKDVVDPDLRDLLGLRLAMRCSTPESSDMILGRGWSGQGFSAATFDSAQRGAALLLAEGALPVRGRGGMLTDPQITALARKAYRLREAAGTLPRRGDDPAARLLRAIITAIGAGEWIWTAPLLEELAEYPEYEGWDAARLADELRPLGVAPDQINSGGRNRKGYRREAIVRALERR